MALPTKMQQIAGFFAWFIVSFIAAGIGGANAIRGAVLASWWGRWSYLLDV